MSDPLLVDVDDAARRLGLSRRKLQDLVYSGELPSVLIGRCRRIATVDLVAYVEHKRAESGGSAWSPAGLTR